MYYHHPRLTVACLGAILVIAACSESPVVPEVPELKWDFASNFDDRHVYSADTVGDAIFVIDHHGGLSSFDPASDSWQALPAMPTPRHDAIVVALEGSLYVVGGDLADGTVTPVVEAFDPRSTSWRSVPDLPFAVCMMGALAHEGRLYVIGGDGAGLDDGGGPVDHVQIYDPTRDEWTQGTKMPIARCGAAVGLHEGKILVTGGINLQEQWTLLDLVQIYDPATDTWSRGNPLPGPRLRHAVMTWNDRLFIVGGQEDGAWKDDPACDTVLEYDHGVWVERTPLAKRRYGHAAAVLNDEFYVFGGRRQLKVQEPTIERGSFR